MATLNTLASDQCDGDILDHEEQAQFVKDFASFLASTID